MDARLIFSSLVLCLAASFSSIDGLAQSDTKRISNDSLASGWSIGMNLHYGVVIPEYSSFHLVTDAFVKSAALSFEKRTSGSNPWNALFNHPSFGFTLFYTSLGNDAVHGNEIAIFPYFRIPLVRSNQLDFGFSLGLGLGYVDKIYDPEENPLNVVIGSHLNIHFQAKLDLRIALNHRLSFQSGLALGHISNANTAEPNIGINNGTVYAGLFYRLTSQTESVSNRLPLTSRDWFFEAAMAPGFKSTRALKGSRHLTYSLTGDAWKPLSRIVAIGVGPDIFYDGSAETELSIDENVEYKPSMQWSTGIHLSVAFRYDRLRLILQGGVYAGLPNEVEDERIYNRGMVRFQLSEHLITYFAMKSHLHILDHPEFGIGYRW